jgi:glycosyltransferase involved in cell wall biosynthesis
MPAPGKRNDQGVASGLKVKVLLSTYNGARFLREQLDSLLTQSYPDVFIDIRDDGSTDDTCRILQEYSGKYPNFHVVYGGNIGVVGSFFVLLREAGENHDFLAFCDQDDIWLPDKIHNAVNAMTGEDNRKPVLYCSRYEFVDEEMKHLGFSRIPRRIGFGNALVENIAAGCTIVINQRAKDLILSKNPDRIVIHDWWFYLISSAFGKVLYDDKVNIKYRQHEGNVIGGTSNFLPSVYRRTREFLKSGKDAFRVRDQAIEFLRCYGHLLDDTNSRVIRGFIDSKNTFYSRVRYSLGMNVWRQSSMDTIILRALILLGYY